MTSNYPCSRKYVLEKRNTCGYVLQLRFFYIRQ